MYAVSIILIVAFGIAGAVLALKMKNATKNVKFFIAATRSCGTLIITMAYFGKFKELSL